MGREKDENVFLFIQFLTEMRAEMKIDKEIFYFSDVLKNRKNR
jgi:hypothetical protein